ncbi:MAG: helix-turn-helix domain-containing protein, partial [Planctomycetota bacterium]
HDLKESKTSFQNLITGAFWVELTTPPLSERREIACQLASQKNLNADPDVFKLLAEDYGSTLRELEAAVSSLAAAGSLQGLDTMGVYMARELLGRVRGGGRRTAPGIKEICEAVTESFDVSMDQLKGRSRRRTVCRARQAAMYFVRKMTDLSLSEVGRWFGRTHSTVKHSVEQAEENMDENPRFADNIDTVREMLEGV